MGLGRAALALYLFGATVGSLLDAIHTYSGTTVYATEIAFKAAWWTPVLFGAAALGTGLSYPLAERLLGRSVAPDPTWTRIALAFAGFVALYLASGFLPASNSVKLGVLVAGAVTLGVTTASRSGHAFGLACVAAIAGPTVEIILVRNGAFRHLQADYLGIPIWLPALYASASFTMGIIGKKITTAAAPANEAAAAAVAATKEPIRLPSSDARSLP